MMSFDALEGKFAQFFKFTPNLAFIYRQDFLFLDQSLIHLNLFEAHNSQTEHFKGKFKLQFEKSIP